MKVKSLKKIYLDKIENYLEKKKEKDYLKFTKFYNSKYKLLRKEVLKEYAKKLNLIHDKNYRPIEWQIIIGPWLDKSLSIYLFYNYFFRENKFKTFFKNFGRKYKLCIPKDYNEFLELVNKREFNPYFIACLKFNLPETVDVNEIKISTNFNWKLYILKFFNLFLKNLVYLSNARFGNKNLFKLFLYSLLKIIPIPNLYNNLSINYLRKKSTLRKKFNKSFDKKNKNYNIFRVLNNILPKFYLEYFESLNTLGLSMIKKPRKIYTDSTYIDDELLKIQIANWKNKKFRGLIIGQHGGNYNLYKSQYLGANENEISDIYIDWHFNKKSLFKNLTSIRLNSFYEKNKIYSNIKKKHAACLVMRPLRKTNFQSVFMELFLYKKNVKEISNFLKCTNRDLIIKYYPEFRYPDQLSIKEVSKEFDFPLEKIKINKDVIFKSDLIIFDYISTMLFEILAFNKPFLLVLDEKKHSLSKHGNEFIKDLKKINIHCSNYKELSVLFNKNNNINQWWSFKKRQKKIKILKKKYGNTSYNFVSHWSKFFLE